MSEKRELLATAAPRLTRWSRRQFIGTAVKVGVATVAVVGKLVAFEPTAWAQIDCIPVDPLDCLFDCTALCNSVVSCCPQSPATDCCCVCVTPPCPSPFRAVARCSSEVAVCCCDFTCG